jgi:cytochrome bd ubiquinol oxidase subunit II
MELSTLWFVLIALLWTGYLVLEGFDFGVGILMPVLGRGRGGDAETRKRMMLNTIGPVWDGNEVWLLTAGGATFAAFPEWYATLFSGFYLPLLLILVALIVRVLGFDYRGKKDDDTWRRRWDAAIVVGSLLPAVLWGVALTNVVMGVPIGADKEYAGSLFTLLNPTALLGGLTTLALFVTHGAFFIALKTDGDLRHDARTLGVRVGVVAAGAAVVLLLLVNSSTGTAASWTAAAVAALSLLAALAAGTRGREGWAFTGTFTTIAAAVACYFLALFPDVMPSSLRSEWSLTVSNASSTPYTLKIMTVVAVVLTPVVLLYQGYTYWVFRKRIAAHHISSVASVPTPRRADGDSLRSPR